MLSARKPHAAPRSDSESTDAEEGGAGGAGAADQSGLAGAFAYEADERGIGVGAVLACTSEVGRGWRGYRYVPLPARAHGGETCHDDPSSVRNSSVANSPVANSSVASSPVSECAIAAPLPSLPPPPSLHELAELHARLLALEAVSCIASHEAVTLWGGEGGGTVRGGTVVEPAGCTAKLIDKPPPTPTLGTPPPPPAPAAPAA